MIKETIANLCQGNDLNWEETEKVLTDIMSGKATSAQISAFLIALKVKGENVEEIVGAARGMLKKAVLLKTKKKNFIDLCGTGGDGHATFNISTVSSFVTAGAGINVAKHGNRSISSRCGSADLLEALGFDLSLSNSDIAEKMDETGFGFLFAPNFHPAMKYAMPPRKEIGVRTIFNIIGPLVNPFRVKRQLIGVYSLDLLKTVSKALQMLGTERSLVVHSDEGLDEISLCGLTRGILIENEDLEEFEIVPEDYGFNSCALDEIKVNSLEENVRYFMDILKGENGPKRDIVLLNSGAAIYVSGAARDIKDGIEMARDSIDSGKALNKFSEFIRLYRRKRNDLFYGKCFIP